MRRSFDGGSTWTSPVTVAGSLVGNSTFRNPYLTVARPFGSAADVLLLQYVDSTFAEPWVTWQTYSTDEGASWSRATQVRRSERGGGGGAGRGVAVGGGGGRGRRAGGASEEPGQDELQPKPQRLVCQ
jgi:hypothetical protein